jgi:hypothetical protein
MSSTVPAAFAITGRGVVVIGGTRWQEKVFRLLHAEIHTPDGAFSTGAPGRNTSGGAWIQIPRDEREGFLLEATEKPEVPTGSSVRDLPGRSTRSLIRSDPGEGVFGDDAGRGFRGSKRLFTNSP